MSPLANSIVPIAPSAMIVRVRGDELAPALARRPAVGAPPLLETGERRRIERFGLDRRAVHDPSRSHRGVPRRAAASGRVYRHAPYNPAPTSLEPGLIDPLEALVIIAAGMAAGTINTIVGSGSLITFPTLLLLGYPPLVANVSNTVGLVPGTISGAIGYRRELHGQRARARPLLIAGGARRPDRGRRCCSSSRPARSPGSCPS